MNTKYATLLSPFTAGPFSLQNRMVMAPMTRGRALGDGTPTPLMASYYAQRASAGLIITEATGISPMAVGWNNAPRIYTSTHVEGWKDVTKAVHAKGGVIFLQLWHMGRVSHPDFLNGETPVAPSAVQATGDAYTPTGKKPFVTPRALSSAEIAATVADYAAAAERAKDAGFDGVEIHGANGYLIDQFLRDCTNKRTDEYGGSVENRLRFLFEVTDAVVAVWGRERVGVRLSPTGPYNGMSDSHPEALFVAAAEGLSNRGILYVHTMEPLPGHPFGSPLPRVTPHMRKVFKGVLIVNGGFMAESAETAVQSGETDLVAFGVPFLANPDLPRRFRDDIPLNAPDMDTFYTSGEKGYTDYPASVD